MVNRSYGSARKIERRSPGVEELSQTKMSTDTFYTLLLKEISAKNILELANPGTKLKTQLVCKRTMAPDESETFIVLPKESQEQAQGQKCIQIHYNPKMPIGKRWCMELHLGRIKDPEAVYCYEQNLDILLDMANYYGRQIVT